MTFVTISEIRGVIRDEDAPWIASRDGLAHLSKKMVYLPGILALNAFDRV
jgi:hypothetical protein